MRKKMADTIRFLCADMVQEANSGHPGAPLGLADIMVVLSEHLRLNPKNPQFINRDRIVFSGGHASSLVYSMLHLWGFDISLEDLKEFRQLGSKTPGHPEFGHTPGVEVTTGPLGQGVANAVGFAMAKKFISNKFPEIDHKIYCLCGDGDLEEGISYEACSLAGKQQLNDLVIIYDDNSISIEGNVKIAFDEDVKKRFEAQGFNVLQINGHNFDEIDSALKIAKNATKPTLIMAKTIIARGAVGLEGSHKTHGAPLGDEIIAESKKAAGFENKKFNIDEDVLARFRCMIEKGELAEAEFNKNANIQEIKAFFNKDYSKIEFPKFEKGEKLATRASNGKILNAIASEVPSFIGGSADLAPSNNTHLNDEENFPVGRNIHFGIREHAMGAINNAFAAYGLAPYVATFLIFSDYLKPAYRIAALSGHKNYWIFTHDTIFVGEDGPTHQPIEQIATLRSIPNSYTFRPADANENVACWKTALNTIQNAPCAFALTRQGIEVFTECENVDKGGYILSEDENAEITLIATGSEVSLAMEIKKLLDKPCNVVSVPCYELFDEQDEEYKNSIIKPNTRKIAIEAATAYEWYKYADEVVNMHTFGASGKGADVYKHFGFDAQTIANKIKG
jgi:transketolase